MKMWLNIIQIHSTSWHVYKNVMSLTFSVELAVIMNKYYSGVCYAGIDVDPELKYPKGAGRVAFSNHTSYINAINNRFIQLKIGDIDKKVCSNYKSTNLEIPYLHFSR